LAPARLVEDAKVLPSDAGGGKIVARTLIESDRVEEERIAADISPVGRSRFLRLAAGLAAATLACGLIAYLLHGSSPAIAYHPMMRAVRATPRRFIWLSISFTTLSYLALLGRDECALTYIGVRISPAPLLLASLCGSALENAIGFGALTGEAVRDRVYGAVGLRSEQIDRVMLFIDAGFTIGLGAFAAASSMLAGPALGRRFGISTVSLELAGAALLLAIFGLVAAGMRRRGGLVVAEELSIAMPAPAIALFQFLLTQIDLLGAAAALWVLLPAASIDFFSFAAVFSVAIGLGAVSRIPAGLGVFDTVVFLSLANHVPHNELAASLLIYRGVYFLLPLMLAAASLAAFELGGEDGNVLAPTTGERALLGSDLLAPVFLSVLTFSAGVMLIVSGATPAVDWRLAALQSVLPLWALEISHLLAALAGVLLMFVARGLYHRLDGAWWMALTIALLNVALSLSKGLAFGETAALLFLIFLLLATRRQFNRPAAFLRQPFTLGWFTAIAVVIAAATGIMFFAFRKVPYRHEIWWQFEFDAQASRALRALLGASILALGISLWQLLRTASGRVELPSAQELSRAALIVRDQERSAAMLALMGDKSFLFSRTGSAFLMYAKRGRSWVALFDPVGPRREWLELVWRFVELADAHGGRAAFYQVRPDSLPVYLDAGLRIMKVGEEACMRLGDFSLQGSARYGLRQALKRGQRDGLEFEILKPGRVSGERDVLRRISDAWLAGHGDHERGFSVAAFEPGFMAAQSVALARLRGRPVAFVSFMATEHRNEATIGLMRQMPDAPPYAMEYLITQLALELKVGNYQVLSLGMAPLAGMVAAPLSSQWHRIAALLWEFGGPVHNFQGLRAFKNKFRPGWEPRYLAASGTIGPFITLADVAALASGLLRRSAAT
jgi:phosphatidylglycerol lysyltransferase